MFIDWQHFYALTKINREFASKYFFGYEIFLLNLNRFLTLMRKNN